jgi:hypothetical protein
MKKNTYIMKRFKFVLSTEYYWNQDRTRGIATGYELEGRGIECRFSTEATDVSLLDSVQTVSGAY